jgi:hypothetical protein
MRAVFVQQSVDLNSTSCATKSGGPIGSHLVLGPWDTTDPNPLGNGGSVKWFNTSDSDCTDPTLSVNRIACKYIAVLELA